MPRRASNEYHLAKGVAKDVLPQDEKSELFRFILLLAKFRDLYDHFEDKDEALREATEILGETPNIAQILEHIENLTIQILSSGGEGGATPHHPYPTIPKDPFDR